MYTESRPPEVTLKSLNSKIEIDNILFLFRENRDEYIYFLFDYLLLMYATFISLIDIPI